MRLFQHRLTVTVVAALVAVTVVSVAVTLRQPHVVTFAPTPPAPMDTGHALVGPIVYTVDATDAERWRYFSFRRGSVIENATPMDWDLGFRRYLIIANGGPGFRGRGGILDLGTVPFGQVHEVPAMGYQLNETNPDPRNAAIAGWYRYGFFSHVLSPKSHVWAVRTAEGRYAKLELISYYCPGRQPGCLTFRYVYQANGSTLVGEANGR
jgi:hypothetical protein